jgi:traG family protein
MIAEISSSANLAGALGYNFQEETIEQKIFHAEVIVDVAKVTAEAKAYQPIPIIVEFLNEDGSNSLSETIEANYKCVKQDILSLVASEIERIKNAPILRQLIRE